MTRCPAPSFLETIPIHTELTYCNHVMRCSGGWEDRHLRHVDRYIRHSNWRRHVINGRSRAHRVSVLTVVVRPGARVTIVEPTTGDRTVRARALDSELAGFQLARVEGADRKLLLTREGITWARGWNTKAADALRVACGL